MKWRTKMAAHTQALKYTEENFNRYVSSGSTKTESKTLDYASTPLFKALQESPNSDSSHLEDNNINYTQSAGNKHPLPSADKSIEKRSKVEGVIIRIKENVSVECEIFIDSLKMRSMQVQLPVGLFPKSIHAGTPIFISYSKDGKGIKRPIVSFRDIELADRMIKENGEMKSLVDQL